MLRGAARKLTDDGDSFQDSMHKYFCITPILDMTVALQSANTEARSVGYVLATVDGDPILVPTWRSWLPTEQGKALRETKKKGVLLVLSRQPEIP